MRATRDNILEGNVDTAVFGLLQKRGVSVLSTEQLRKAVPEVQDLSEDELVKLRDSLYPIIENMLDKFFEDDAKIEP